MRALLTRLLYLVFGFIIGLMVPREPEIEIKYVAVSTKEK